MMRLLVLKNHDYVHVYYDFQYHPSCNMSKEEFDYKQKHSYEEWHVLCCTALKVPPVYDYNELINYIGLDKKDLTDNILMNSIYELNSYEVIDLKFV